MYLLLIGLVLLFAPSLQGIQIIWDNNVDWDDNKINEIESSKEDIVRMPNWFFIFPGTKWCGAGNIADNEDDLGEYAETDKCCRAHDFCDDIIEAHQTKHNLTNPTFYTRLNCKCDKKFYKCLKEANAKPATQIGHIYFTGLGTQCFRNDYPVVRCIRHTYVPTRKCIEYEYDTTKDKVYQWFDVPNF